jgi:hypothetical protein
MRRCVAFVLGGMSIAVSSTTAQTASIAGPPTIVTTGAGEASAVPDRATIYVAVQTRAPTVSAAAADNARRVRAVMDTLRAIGLSGNDVETASYNVSPEMSYPTAPSQTPRAVAYTVANSLLVRLRRIEDVGRVIDAALAKGANEISSLQFSSSKADSVRSIALAAAVADARAQADAMARAAGGSLGPLMELNTSAPIRPMPFVQTFAARSAMATPIAPGEQTINATVTGRWAFVPGR